MGTLHARTLAGFDDVTVDALYNRTRSKAEKLGAELNATVCDSMEELLDRDLDAVYVATPDNAHVEPARAVLESGKHLFLEKAIATNLEDGAAIVEAAAAHPELITMVGYPLRFDPCYRKMKEILSGENVGNIAQAWSIRAHFIDPNVKVYDKYRDEYYDPPSFYFDEAQGKGPIYSHASHDYDMFTWFCGEIESVFAYGGTYILPAGSVNDGFTVALRFKNGGVASVSTPWVTRVEYDFVGVATEQLTVVNNNNEVRLKRATGPEERTAFTENDMWTHMNRHFIDSVRNKTQPLITPADGLRAIAVSEAAYRSLKERREVAVEVPQLPSNVA